MPFLNFLLAFVLLQLSIIPYAYPQVKTDLVHGTITLPNNIPKLNKTQGTTQFANIQCAIKDTKDNLWFATTGEGAYRFDGKSFTQFTVKDGMTSNFVYSIIEDRSGMIWFGTANSACYYDGKKINALPINFKLGSNVNIDMYGVPSIDRTVWSLMQDKKGIIWLGTTEGVFCYDGSSITSFPNQSSLANKQSYNLKMIDCMYEDSNSYIWFCSGMLPGNEGVFRYNSAKGEMSNFKPLGDGWIRRVIEDKEGNLLFTTRHKGVCKFDGNTFMNLTEKAGIDNGSATSTYLDSKGNLWIGTELGSGQLGEDGGVWRFDGKSVKRFTTGDGLVHNGVFTIIEDKSGNLWFGTRNIGLCRFDGKTFTNFSK